MKTTHLYATQAIGIFDSGIGGLTVAQAVKNLLPNEKIIYFGDVAHHPYGEKSSSAIQAYCIKICDFLLEKNVKLILIACHSAASAAYELVTEYVASKAKVISVIDPVINMIRENFANQTMGLIGTRQTVDSGIYAEKIQALKSNIVLKSLATPLLAPMIEEGYAYTDNPILTGLLADYLSHYDLKNIQALLLGCTHYPLIKSHIQAYYTKNHQRQPVLIDSAAVTAEAVKGLLAHHHLLNNGNHTHERLHEFYVSDYTEAFIASAKFFFPDEFKNLRFELFSLWE